MRHRKCNSAAALAQQRLCRSELCRIRGGVLVGRPHAAACRVLQYSSTCSSRRACTRLSGFLSKHTCGHSLDLGRSTGLVHVSRANPSSVSLSFSRSPSGPSPDLKNTLQCCFGFRSLAIIALISALLACVEVDLELKPSRQCAKN